MRVIRGENVGEFWGCRTEFGDLPACGVHIPDLRGTIIWIKRNAFHVRGRAFFVVFHLRSSELGSAGRQQKTPDFRQTFRLISDPGGIIKYEK